MKRPPPPPPAGATPVHVPTDDKRHLTGGLPAGCWPALCVGGCPGPAGRPLLAAARKGGVGGGGVPRSQLTEWHTACFQLSQASLSKVPSDILRPHLTEAAGSGALLADMMMFLTAEIPSRET